jgi:hypothetical protein
MPKVPFILVLAVFVRISEKNSTVYLQNAWNLGQFLSRKYFRN